MNGLRSVLHALVMLLTVVPYALFILALAAVGVRGERLYWVAAAWLRLCIQSARMLIGIRYEVQGFEHLPEGKTSPAVLLVKHQSTYETFLMPAIMPHPLAYVFKRELLSIPFFGWAMGRLDMIHIDRSQRAKAFAKVVEQGKDLLAKGVWVIMFPEGTRIPRGQRGQYKSGGARLAVATDTPVIPIAVTSARCWPRWTTGPSRSRPPPRCCRRGPRAARVPKECICFPRCASDERSARRRCRERCLPPRKQVSNAGCRQTAARPRPPARRTTGTRDTRNDRRQSGRHSE